MGRTLAFMVKAFFGSLRWRLWWRRGSGLRVAHDKALCGDMAREFENDQSPSRGSYDRQRRRGPKGEIWGPSMRRRRRFRSQCAGMRASRALIGPSFWQQLFSSILLILLFQTSTSYTFIYKFICASGTAHLVCFMQIKSAWIQFTGNRHYYWRGASALVALAQCPLDLFHGEPGRIPRQPFGGGGMCQWHCAFSLLYAN